LVQGLLQLLTFFVSDKEPKRVEALPFQKHTWPWFDVFPKVFSPKMLSPYKDSRFEPVLGFFTKKCKDQHQYSAHCLIKPKRQQRGGFQKKMFLC
jgi:hypothetical protein